MVVAPLAAALAFGHLRRALGARRAAGELLALAAYGFALEWVSMAVFASHRYAATWRAAPLGVPLAVAAVWAAVICAAIGVAGRREGIGHARRAVTAALVAVSLDLMIEPVAVRAGLWSWTPPGPWLDVPVGNFVGWGVIVGAYAYGAERWAGAGRAAVEMARRLALAAGCILALVLVGVTWTSLGMERAFAGGRGWLFWAAVLVATAWNTRRRVGATKLPRSVLCLVGLPFATDALLLGDAAIAVAAAGPLAVVGLIGTASSGSPAPSPSATASPARAGRGRGAG